MSHYPSVNCFSLDTRKLERECECNVIKNPRYVLPSCSSSHFSKQISTLLTESLRVSLTTGARLSSQLEVTELSATETDYLFLFSSKVLDLGIYAVKLFYLSAWIFSYKFGLFKDSRYKNSDSNFVLYLNGINNTFFLCGTF